MYPLKEWEFPAITWEFPKKKKDKTSLFDNGILSTWVKRFIACWLKSVVLMLTVFSSAFLVKEVQDSGHFKKCSVTDCSQDRRGDSLFGSVCDPEELQAVDNEKISFLITSYKAALIPFNNPIGAHLLLLSGCCECTIVFLHHPPPFYSKFYILLYVQMNGKWLLPKYITNCKALTQISYLLSENKDWSHFHVLFRSWPTTVSQTFCLGVFDVSTFA